MTKDEMVTAISNSIDSDSQLIILLRVVVKANIPNVPEERLAGIMSVLGLPMDPPSDPPPAG